MADPRRTIRSATPPTTPGARATGRARSANRSRADGPIRLADYDPAWPGLYEREAARIRGAAGRPRPAAGAHRLDVRAGPRGQADHRHDLAVADSADEPAYVPDLEAGGYVLRVREPDWFEHRLFKGPDTASTCTSSRAGSPEIDRMLAFRDRLRTHDDDRRSVRGHQARAGSPRLGLRPGLCRCQGRGRRRRSSRGPWPNADDARPR